MQNKPSYRWRRLARGVRIGRNTLFRSIAKASTVTCAACTLSILFWVCFDIYLLSSDQDSARRMISSLDADVGSSMRHERKLDFTQQLPATARAMVFTRGLQRHADHLNVLIVSFSTTLHGSTPERLGRVDLTVGLRGDYSDVKSVLAEAFALYPVTTLEHVFMTRHSPHGLTEANVRVRLWTQSMPSRAMDTPHAVAPQ